MMSKKKQKEFPCNQCGETFEVAKGNELMHFCPNCGAKMKGSKAEEIQKKVFHSRRCPQDVTGRGKRKLPSNHGLHEKVGMKGGE